MRIRYEDINPAFIKGLVISLVVAHVVNWAVCYGLSISNGTLLFPNLFLSRAMQSDPARAVACILFPTVAMLTGLVLLLRSILLAARLRTKSQRVMWTMFNICAGLSVFGMVVVPAVPYTLHKAIHLTAAFTVFISGFTIMFVSSFLDRSLKLPVVRWMKYLRYGLTALALLGSVGFAVFFNYLDAVSSISELVAAGCMTAYICTLAHDSDFFSASSSEIAEKPAESA